MPWAMKHLRPMRAAGWISMPVSTRAMVESQRASQRRSTFQRKWWPRCSSTASTPG